MDQRELIRAVNEVDPATLKKVKAIADFRLGSHHNKNGLSTDEQLFYQSILTILAQNNAGFAEQSDISQLTRLPGFNVDELRAAQRAVDALYERSFSPGTLSKAKFYRLVAACAFKWITAQPKRRHALNRAREMLHDRQRGGGSRDAELESVLKHMVKVFSEETVSINRSVKGMITALQSADVLLEEAFPGYLQSGLLRMILQRGNDKAVLEAVE